MYSGWKPFKCNEDDLFCTCKWYVREDAAGAAAFECPKSSSATLYSAQQEQTKQAPQQRTDRASQGNVVIVGKNTTAGTFIYKKQRT
eukprot:9982479-Alexandrium_andersonii.AAC.1